MPSASTRLGSRLSLRADHRHALLRRFVHAGRSRRSGPHVIGPRRAIRSFPPRLQRPDRTPRRIRHDAGRATSSREVGVDESTSPGSHAWQRLVTVRRRRSGHAAGSGGPGELVRRWWAVAGSYQPSRSGWRSRNRSCAPNEPSRCIVSVEDRQSCLSSSRRGQARRLARQAGLPVLHLSAWTFLLPRSFSLQRILLSLSCTRDQDCLRGTSRLAQNGYPQIPTARPVPSSRPATS